MNYMEFITEVGQQVLAGQCITMEQAVTLSQIPDQDLPFLFAMADKIRQQFVGDEVDLCVIVNGRSGKCTENCSFCAQSMHHKANISVYPLLSEEELLAAAKQAEANGSHRFSIVTSGRGAEQDKDFAKIIKTLERIKSETKLKVCASLGTLSAENAKALKAAGVSRYHHNVETSRSHYGEICTTHSYDDRANTIKVAHEAGLEVCSGGIIGMGESMQHRLEMAFELREFGVHSVPLNILNPIKGTAMADQEPLLPLEIIKVFALFRFIMPKMGIRSAGGREVNLRDLQSVGLMSGLSGMLIGGYLTTGGRESAMDLQMIRDMGRVPLSAKED